MTLIEKKSSIFVQCCFAPGMTIQHLVTHLGKSQGVPKRVLSAWVEPIVNGFRTRTKLSTCGIVGTYKKSLVPSRIDSQPCRTFLVVKICNMKSCSHKGSIHLNCIGKMSLFGGHKWSLTLQ
jgi:hypothetical protein